jgi:hypothetical protein
MYPCSGSFLPLQEELLCPELSGVQLPTVLPTGKLVPQLVALATVSLGYIPFSVSAFSWYSTRRNNS